MSKHPQAPTLDALDELVEVFTGLSAELEWSTSEDIYRKELLPIFHLCATGTLKPDQALEVALSNIIVKRDETFAVMLKICQRLNQQLGTYDLVKKPETQRVENGGGEEHV